MSSRKKLVKKQHKTLYVLGAGFSYSAGYPVQSKILNLIRSDALPGIMDLPYDALPNLKDYIQDMEVVQKFVDCLYPAGSTPQLEDIFTLLDQATLGRKSFQGYGWKELVDIDLSFKRTILFLFHKISDENKSKSLKIYDKFVKHLIKSRELQDANGKKISILSLNWDDFLEEKIYQHILAQKKVGKIDVDYCCYTNRLDNQTPHTISFHQKPLKIKNIKVLKMHGSINWLTCPVCSRIYTGLGSKSSRWERYSLKKPCACLLEKSFRDDSCLLQPLFITPTYLKSLENNHIQSIWNNAFIELSEADKIVFIGYSLPESDFYFRSLMKRSIKAGIPIEAVLVRADRPHKSVANPSAYAFTRFKNFFGSRNLKISLTGLEGYVHNL